MATVTVEAILSRAAVLLQDATNIRWPKLELLDWLNDGQREIVLKKPNAYVKNAALPLIMGSKQTIPSDGVQLLKVVRNLPGNAIRIVDMEILDSQAPNWHMNAPQQQVVHYCYHEQDLKNFYVYPPNNGAGVVELVYSAAPPNTILGGVIAIDDIYLSALVDYVMYRAYGKDAEFAADPQRANNHYIAFSNALGGKMQMEVGFDPNTKAQFNPNLPRHAA